MPKPRTLHEHPAAKKRFGQNFLVDPGILARIVKAARLTSGDRVIEIGPGRGALTRELIRSGAEIWAVEIDHDLQADLANEFAEEEGFHLVGRDILQTRLADMITAPCKVVGNLPYNISTAILERLISERELFTDAVLMFQREVADRILARENTPDRGFLSVIAQAAFEITKGFDIGPGAFRPQPKVWSSVVRLIPKEQNIFDRVEVRKLVSKGFSQRRKMLKNTLAGLVGQASGIDLTRRAESLSLDEWQALTENAERS
ncbi:MAG: ribosomal RNA small subunit methyltransferase A [Acidobacteria bacterium]|nr:ribosomal RNA small subunit methyltransferase A [Acidobacteriota bacterium]